MRLNEFQENSSKFYIQRTIVEPGQNSRPAPVTKDGEILYFDSFDDAQSAATARSERMNTHGARQFFRFEVKPVE